MSSNKGRPSKMHSHDIINTILVYKNRIMLSGNKIISKHNTVWTEISVGLGNHISPISLYTMVSCNRYGIRNQLVDRLKDINAENIEEDNIEEDNINTSNSMDSTYNESSASIDTKNVEPINFTITLARDEFEKLIIFKSYKRMQKNKLRNRIWKTFRPGVWEEFITSKIWDSIQLKCGFRFRNHYLSNIDTSGYINGSCKCGSSLRCDIESDSETEVLLKCKIFKGFGKCGKRYLRKPLRTIIGEELLAKPIEVYRAEKANKLMTSGDPEPPHLYKASILHVAKSEYKKSHLFDNDSIKALCIMKYSAYFNCIHNISIDPFFVHYWTNHQMQIYKKYCSTNTSAIYIDATGSIVKKLMKIDNSLSKHIFLYQAVINYNGNQFSITQMLSESHTTNNIHFWLLEWCRMGAPYPREIVVDSSKALLNAIIRCFTSYATIKDYANACKIKTMPECYVRIDNAHCIKIYSNFLKNLPRRIKVFYMAAIGQLIMCRNIEDATIIFRAILTVARSETEGGLINGEETYCEKEKKD